MAFLEIKTEWVFKNSYVFVRLFTLAKRLAKSLGLDYMHDPWQDSLWDSFFMREVPRMLAHWKYKKDSKYTVINI